jgi:membrane associated rhomboid family serine protease
MGMAERNYRTGWGAAGSGPARVTPVVKWLLIVNVAVFFGDVLLLDHRLLEWGAFSIQSALWQGRVWEFLTFQFLHGSVLHLLFNSVGLFFFGPWMERWWGTRRFVVFYLLCGAAGAAFYTLLWSLGVFPGEGAGTGLIGASAGIYGILMGVAVIAPNLRVALIFPPIEMSMRQLAILVLVIAAGTVLTGFGNNEGGEAGHLGGAILGLLLVRVPRLLTWADRPAPAVEIIRPKAFEMKSAGKLRPRTEVDLALSSEVDRILDKVSQHGFQSLTQAERAILVAASKSNSPYP